jgi:hypothetical protein
VSVIIMTPSLCGVMVGGAVVVGRDVSIQGLSGI